MKTPTKEQIAAEIAALEKLKPVGKFAQKTAASIAIAIEELKYGVDRSAPEWEEMSDDQRDMAEQAYAWKAGMNKSRPSADWGALCA